MTSPAPEYQLFTSLRYDPKLLSAPFNTEVCGSPSPFLLFPYHVDRLVTAANFFRWPRAIEVISAQGAAEFVKKKCEQAVSAHLSDDKEQNGLRLRILLESDGTITVQTFDAEPLQHDFLAAAYFNPDKADENSAPQPVYSVHIDSQPTPATEFTCYKTTAREHYEAARARGGFVDRAVKKEVVLYNEKGELTEASYRNVALWQERGWVSPLDSSGGLPGTVRRWLLDHGLVKEALIRKEDVRKGQWVLLTNGIEVAVLGRIVSKST